MSIIKLELLNDYNRVSKVYATLFALSLMLFLINFLIQGRIVFTYSDFYGLIFKLNWPFWLGYFILLILVYFHFSNFARIDERFAFLTISLLVIYLIGTPFFLEYLPRFQDTWSHSLLAQRIYETGKVSSAGNPYDEYPGSFFLYGLLFDILPSFYVMKFFPVLFYIFGIITIFLVFKNLIDVRTALLIAVMYMLFNWTVEDNHISPQFLTLNLYFLLMLATIKILDGSKRRREYTLVIGLLSLVIVFSHVLTPIFIISILMFTCILCKKLRKLALPILVLVIALFLTHEMFLATKLSSFVEYVKNLRDIFSISPMYENALHRLSGVELLSRQIFLGSRFAILFLSIFLGLLGLRALSKKYSTTAKFIFSWSFSLVPFLIIMVLVLKGEFAERFALVSSLPLSVVAAWFFTQHKSKFLNFLILAFLLILSPLYFVSKYGNEAFESESIEKLKVDCFVDYFNSNCDKDFIIVDSPLNGDMENLGKTHFAVSREEIMSARIYKGGDIDEDVFDLIERIENERKLNRVYSTNEAWFYIG